MFFPKNDEPSKNASTQTEAPKKKEVDTEEVKLMRFRDSARKIFIDQWLQDDSNWIANLNKAQLDFLRDVLGLENQDNKSKLM